MAILKKGGRDQNAPAGALKQLADLEEQLLNVAAHVDNGNARRLQQQRERAEIDQELRAEHIRAARAGEPPDTDALDRRLIVLSVDTEANHKAGRAAMAARREVEREIQVVHERGRAAFVGVAERASAEVAEPLAALQRAYAAAHDAWQHAEATWHDALSEYKPPAGERHGGFDVPRWPLEEMGELIAALPAPQPPAFVPARERTPPEGPGEYVDTKSGSRSHVELQQIEGNPYFVPDEYGFVRMRRVNP